MRERSKKSQEGDAEGMVRCGIGQATRNMERASDAYKHKKTLTLERPGLLFRKPER
ncbi:hypothetical protein GCM10011586_07890 [Silvibacterium dinghuense]|nr:hypothetical protein GCM10011586_07890 [Silvibacterium dinghuense]